MISDDKIKLRAPEPDDIDCMYIWENDPVIWADGALRAPMSRKMLSDFVNYYNPDPASAGQLRLIIEDTSNGMAIGCIDLYEYDSVNRRAGVGVVISREHQSKGFATRALNLMCNYCQVALGLHQLWAIISRTNYASLKLFSKCDFETCGNLRSWIRNGTSYTDALIMQRLLV